MSDFEEFKFPDWAKQPWDYEQQTSSTPVAEAVPLHWAAQQRYGPFAHLAPGLTICAPPYPVPEHVLYHGPRAIETYLREADRRRFHLENYWLKVGVALDYRQGRFIPASTKQSWLDKGNAEIDQLQLQAMKEGWEGLPKNASIRRRFWYRFLRDYLEPEEESVDEEAEEEEATPPPATP